MVLESLSFKGTDNLVICLFSQLVIFLWILIPYVSLIVFLMVASYHFGKEDTQLFIWTNYAKQSVTLYRKYTKSYYFFAVDGKNNDATPNTNIIFKTIPKVYIY